MPHVEHCWELEAQDTCPAPGYSKAKFFRSQEKLKESRVEHDLWRAIEGAEATILAVPQVSKHDSLCVHAGRRLAVPARMSSIPVCEESHGPPARRGV